LSLGNSYVAQCVCTCSMRACHACAHIVCTLVSRYIFIIFAHTPTHKALTYARALTLPLSHTRTQAEAYQKDVDDFRSKNCEVLAYFALAYFAISF